MECINISMINWDDLPMCAKTVRKLNGMNMMFLETEFTAFKMELRDIIITM